VEVRRNSTEVRHLSVRLACGALCLHIKEKKSGFELHDVAQKLSRYSSLVE